MGKSYKDNIQQSVDSGLRHTNKGKRIRTKVKIGFKVVGCLYSQYDEGTGITYGSSNLYSPSIEYKIYPLSNSKWFMISQ